MGVRKGVGAQVYALKQKCAVDSASSKLKNSENALQLTAIHK
jgi:hypothetical protein